jgi:hypothetical protein
MSAASEVSRHFSIRRLLKSLVERTHGKRSTGCDEDDDVIDNSSELLCGRRARDGCRQYDPTGAARSNAHYGSTGRGTSRDPVVHNNDTAPNKVKGAVMLSVLANSSLEFELLTRRRARKLLFGNVQPVTDLAFSSRHTALGEGAHRELGLRGYADLAHHNDVERRPQDSCDFVGNNDSPSGQTQHDDGLGAPVRAEANSEQPSSFGSINEPLHALGLASSSRFTTAPAASTSGALVSTSLIALSIAHDVRWPRADRVVAQDQGEGSRLDRRPVRRSDEGIDTRHTLDPVPPPPRQATGEISTASTDAARRRHHGSVAWGLAIVLETPDFIHDS